MRWHLSTKKLHGYFKPPNFYILSKDFSYIVSLQNCIKIYSKKKNKIIIKL